MIDRDPSLSRPVISRRMFIAGAAATAIAAACGGDSKRQEADTRAEIAPTTTEAEVRRETSDQQLDTLIGEKAAGVATRIREMMAGNGIEPERLSSEASGLDTEFYDLLTSGNKSLQVSIDTYSDAQKEDGSLAGVLIQRLNGAPLNIQFFRLEDGAWALDITTNSFEGRYGGVDGQQAAAQLQEVPEVFDGYWRGLEAELFTSSAAAA